MCNLFYSFATLNFHISSPFLFFFYRRYIFMLGWLLSLSLLLLSLWLSPSSSSSSSSSSYHHLFSPCRYWHHHSPHRPLCFLNISLLNKSSLTTAVHSYTVFDLYIYMYIYIFGNILLKSNKSENKSQIKYINIPK